MVDGVMDTEGGAPVKLGGVRDVVQDKMAQRPPSGPAQVGLTDRKAAPEHTSIYGVASRYGSVALLAVVMVVFSVLSPEFLTVANLGGLFKTEAVGASVSLAVLIPLIAGEFDLSVGYMIGLLSLEGAVLMQGGITEFPMIVIVLATGVACGLVNGILVVNMNVSAFIATLATGIILSALTQGLSHGLPVVVNVTGLLHSLGDNNLLGVGISVWLVIVIAIIMLVALEYTAPGRRLYATGGAERVAFMAGVPTKRLRILSFVFAAFIVAIGALMELGAQSAGDPSFGPELLLPGYAAVFLGVTTHRPGYYNVVGTVVAVVLLAVGFDGLSLLGVPFWAEPLFDGAVLLAAVLLARREARQVKVGF
jgi:ribose transport system permease protein